MWVAAGVLALLALVPGMPTASFLAIAAAVGFAARSIGKKEAKAEGLREAVTCDLGLAVTAEWLFSPELKSGQVVPILQDWALPTTNLFAVYPTGRLASTKARAFVSFVERCMAA